MKVLQNLTTSKEKILVIDGNEGTYITGEGFCTCPSGIWRPNKTCHHQEVVRNMPIEFGEAKTSIRYFDSTIKSLNEKFHGSLYSSDDLVAVYAKAGTGKSLLLVQETFGFASKGYNVLYIGTEGGEQGMISAWYDVFEARFKPKGKMYVEVKKSLEELCDYLGFKVQVAYVQSKGKKIEEGEDIAKTAKGKMEFRVIQSNAEGAIDKFIKDNNINLVIVDSITSPIRLAIVDEQQNNPAKASATALICGKLLKLQSKFKIGVVVTAHAMFNPADVYETMATMRGGITIQHYAKRVIYLDMREKTELKDYRRAWVVRSEDTPKFQDVIGLKISDSGIEEVPIENLLTDTEKGKLDVYGGQKPT